jgi:hypothetical protein
MKKQPADKTAKRLSADEWFARYDGVVVPMPKRAPPPKQRPPGDRVAIRA